MMRAHIFRCLSALTLVLVVGGCVGPLSTLDPAGPAAERVAMLWWVMFWGSVVLFLLVTSLLALTYLRPGFAANVTPTQWIVFGGLVMPIAVLTVLVGYALYAGERQLPDPDGPRQIEVRAERWLFTFAYPDIDDQATTSVLIIPAGEPVDLAIESVDVIHSFWVPRLGGKMDAIPGHRNFLRIEADRPGTYRGVCAEYCGIGHTDMGFIVQAVEAENYEQAVREASQ